MVIVLRSLSCKEVLHILRDTGTVRLVLFIPLMQLTLFGFIDQTVHDVPTVVVDQDRIERTALRFHRSDAGLEDLQDRDPHQ